MAIGVSSDLVQQKGCKRRYHVLVGMWYYLSKNCFALTARPKAGRKSIPRIRWERSAITKTQGKHHLKPRSSVSGFRPYVLIEGPLAAFGVTVIRRMCWPGETGIILTLEPVLIRNLMELDRSKSQNRRAYLKPVVEVAFVVWILPFSHDLLWRCMEGGIYRLRYRNADDIYNRIYSIE